MKKKRYKQEVWLNKNLFDFMLDIFMNCVFFTIFKKTKTWIIVTLYS